MTTDLFNTQASSDKSLLELLNSGVSGIQLLLKHGGALDGLELLGGTDALGARHGGVKGHELLGLVGASQPLISGMGSLGGSSVREDIVLESLGLSWDMELK